MSWEKLPPIDSKDLHIGCLTCSTACLEAPMGMIIAVGFGSACITCDGKVKYDEMDAQRNDEPLLSVSDAEAMAVADPDHDWRIDKDGPLHGETFQRHGPEKWVCVASNQGFA